MHNGCDPLPSRRQKPLFSAFCRTPCTFCFAFFEHFTLNNNLLEYRHGAGTLIIFFVAVLRNLARSRLTSNFKVDTESLSLAQSHLASVFTGWPGAIFASFSRKLARGHLCFLFWGLARSRALEYRIPLYGNLFLSSDFSWVSGFSFLALAA